MRQLSTNRNNASATHTARKAAPGDVATNRQAGFRFNLFGFAVAELNLVRPFDRPAKNWIWEFNLQPGF